MQTGGKLQAGLECLLWRLKDESWHYRIRVSGIGSQIYPEKHYDVRVYDIDGRGSWNDVIGSNATLVCVSTNEDTDGTLDMRNILSVARDLEKSNYCGLMIIKSTLQPEL